MLLFCVIKQDMDFTFPCPLLRDCRGWDRVLQNGSHGKDNSKNTWRGFEILSDIQDAVGRCAVMQSCTAHLPIFLSIYSAFKQNL